MIKKHLITPVVLVLSASLMVERGHASTIYSLNASGFIGGVFNSDGWTQSEANFSPDNPRAYVQPFSGGVTGFAVGGFYDTEPFASGSSTLTLSRALAGGSGARGASLNAVFQMQDSSVLNNPADPASGYFDVDRNQFSVGLGNLVSLVLRPVAQSSDPGNDNAVWNPFLAVGNELRPFTGAQIQEGGAYTFSLSLNSFTSGLNYNASLTDLGGTFITASGSIPGAAATDSLTTADVGWSLAGTEVDEWGSNSIAISALAVSIPEPSSALLSLIAFLPLALLRRR